MENLPLGKLPATILEKVLSQIPQKDKRVIIGPGTGLDCAVIDVGDQYLVVKSDPISLTSNNIGFYSVAINVNDISTTGADPKWMMVTLLLPENQTTQLNVEEIFNQLIQETQIYDITIIGGHTEITKGIVNPILSATLMGVVDKDKLITPKGVEIGNKIFVTKEIPIETISILANDFSKTLEPFLSKNELLSAKNYLHQPGISVYKEASLLRHELGVTAMHDPTEGGISSALWELSIASNKILQIDISKIPVSELSQKICDLFSINSLNSISSGSLLFTARPQKTDEIFALLTQNNIQVSEIGIVTGVGEGVYQLENGGLKLLPRPDRDEITKVF